MDKNKSLFDLENRKQKPTYTRENLVILQCLSTGLYILLHVSVMGLNSIAIWFIEKIIVMVWSSI